MKVEITIDREYWYADLNNSIDISLVTAEIDSPLAWYVPPIKISPIMTDRFIGSVQKGGYVNFRNILFNPHGNCTHTESVGHLTREIHPVNQLLNKYHFLAQLITVDPIQLGIDVSEFEKKGDFQIGMNEVKGKINSNTEALIIRTAPNTIDKKTRDHNETNWPYLLPDAAKYIRESGVKHLLIDQPSIDKEEDGGRLLAHRAFWNYDNEIDLSRTITELIYVPNNVLDDLYLLNLSFSNLENDASPSRPLLFSLKQ